VAVYTYAARKLSIRDDLLVIAIFVNGAIVSREVEVDGTYFGGHVPPANYKANRRDSPPC